MGSTDKSTIEKILHQYDQKERFYNDFLDRILVLLKEFIEAEGPSIHSISARVKNRKSLQIKLENSPISFKDIGDVPDVAGIRIITYFEDEVKLISEIIRREFNIFQSLESPESLYLDPDRFGYLSKSYLGGLHDNRLELIEYRRYKEFLVEFQVKSVLQNAWSEINQNLGFKTRDQCPTTEFRAYGRVAALFELADAELNTISYNIQNSKKLEESEDLEKTFLKDIKHQTLENTDPHLKETGTPPHQINAIPPKPFQKQIDYETLENFVLNSRMVAIFDREIADHYDTRLIFKEKSIRILMDALTYFNIDSVEDIEDTYKHYQQIIKPISVAMFGDKSKRTYEHISRGVSILIICYALIGKTGNLNTIFQYVTKTYFENDTSSPEASTGLIAAFKSNQ